SIFIYEFGTYTVTMITDDGCKVDSITKPNLLTVAPPSPPQGINGNRIDAGSVILSSIKDTGLIEWYDAPKDGNLLDVNDEYATPPITRTTYYYIQKSVPGPLAAVGPKDNTLGTGSYVSTAGSSNYIVFNCLKASTLVSIVVYSQQSKPRTFQLRDATGAVLQEQNIQVGTGKQTVNLNFNLPIQDDLRLTILDTETPQFYKNTAGVLYPYVLQDMIIIKSSGTLTEYPFFYNWTIQDAPCVSERVLVKAIINNLEDNRILTLNDNIKVYPNPSSDYFFIEQTGIENYQSFMLTDVQGRIVLRGSLAGSEKSKIDITSLTKGIYQLKLIGNQLEELNHKMIIE
ncbi:MAG: T9SS type A sorting domain-containing protein, partial [Chitinophagales bacterium]|nr:T9SS type A sorting domain-containing protein [Chitinophagales bacterium]